MAKLTFVGQGNGKALANELKNIFTETKLNCELAGETRNETNETILLVFEKYFMRTKNVSASILIYPFHDGIKVDVIGSGGGQGVLPYDWGIGNSIAKNTMKILLDMGFRKVA